jgi:hypothetical protein
MDMHHEELQRNSFNGIDGIEKMAYATPNKELSKIPSSHLHKCC